MPISTRLQWLMSRRLPLFLLASPPNVPAEQALAKSQLTAEETSGPTELVSKSPTLEPTLTSAAPTMVIGDPSLDDTIVDEKTPCEGGPQGCDESTTACMIEHQNYDCEYYGECCGFC